MFICYFFLKQKWLICAQILFGLICWLMSFRVTQMLKRAIFRWIRTVFAILTMSSLCYGKKLLWCLPEFYRIFLILNLGHLKCEEVCQSFRNCYSGLADLTEAFLSHSDSSLSLSQGFWKIISSFWVLGKLIKPVILK